MKNRKKRTRFIEWMVYTYIRKRASQEKEEILYRTKEGIKEALLNAVNSDLLEHVLVTYLWCLDFGVKYSNMSFWPRFNWCYINSEWAYILSIRNDEEVKTAFAVTIGHELTHKENFSFRKAKISHTKLTREDKMFLNWVNEVYADYGGAVKMGSGKKETLLQALHFKLTYAEKDQKIHTDGFYHPCWDKRIKYANNGRFDSGLIAMIAEDAGCHNLELIRIVNIFFVNKEIILSVNGKVC